MAGEDIREAVEIREGALDFVDVWEAAEGRADRGAALPGMIDLVYISILDESGQVPNA
jgi:hypothetical protein